MKNIFLVLTLCAALFAEGNALSIGSISDNEAGEGYVRMEDYFLNKSTLFQIDCLKDWIAELQETYNELVPVWEDEMEKMGAQEK